ncbi:MAG: hypothetical protein E3J64_05470 [Anaerolineales bacterium]|nr:MAG: hypothetical protein E3J64_05470 [Anaerolineales bacterium]
MSATSVVCAPRVEETGPAEERRRPKGAEGEQARPGEISESVIRATLAAFTAEKRRAKKHCEDGNRHFARSEFRKALDEFRSALKLCPRDPEYSRAVAKAELALGVRPAR